MRNQQHGPQRLNDSDPWRAQRPGFSGSPEFSGESSMGDENQPDGWRGQGHSTGGYAQGAGARGSVAGRGDGYRGTNDEGFGQGYGENFGQPGYGSQHRAYTQQNYSEQQAYGQQSGGAFGQGRSGIQTGSYQQARGYGQPYVGPGYGQQGAVQGYGPQSQGYQVGTSQGCGVQSQGYQGGSWSSGSQDSFRQGSGPGYGQTLGQSYGQNPGRSRGVAPRSYKRSDERVSEMVCERLIEEGLDCSGVDVHVKEGIVTLSGEVRERADKHRIEQLAAETSGVNDVENQLRVSRKSSQSESGTKSGGEHGTNSSGAATGIGAAATKGASEASPYSSTRR